MTYKNTGVPEILKVHIPIYDPMGLNPVLQVGDNYKSISFLCPKLHKSTKINLIDRNLNKYLFLMKQKVMDIF